MWKGLIGHLQQPSNQAPPSALHSFFTMMVNETVLSFVNTSKTLTAVLLTYVKKIVYLNNKENLELFLYTVSKFLVFDIVP